MISDAVGVSRHHDRPAWTKDDRASVSIMAENAMQLLGAANKHAPHLSSENQTHVWLQSPICADCVVEEAFEEHGLLNKKALRLGG